MKWGSECNLENVKKLLQFREAWNSVQFSECEKLISI